MCVDSDSWGPLSGEQSTQFSGENVSLTLFKVKSLTYTLIFPIKLTDFSNKLQEHISKRFVSHCLFPVIAPCGVGVLCLLQSQRTSQLFPCSRILRKVQLDFRLISPRSWIKSCHLDDLEWISSACFFSSLFCIDLPSLFFLLGSLAFWNPVTLRHNKTKIVCQK